MVQSLVGWLQIKAVKALIKEQRSLIRQLKFVHLRHTVAKADIPDAARNETECSMRSITAIPEVELSQSKTIYSGPLDLIYQISLILVGLLKPPISGSFNKWKHFFGPVNI